MLNSMNNSIYLSHIQRVDRRIRRVTDRESRAGTRNVTGRLTSRRELVGEQRDENKLCDPQLPSTANLGHNNPRTSPSINQREIPQEICRQFRKSLSRDWELRI